MQETWAQSLGWEDPLEKGKATHSTFLAWRIHGLHSPWGRKESDTTERISLHSFTAEPLGKPLEALRSRAGLIHPCLHFPCGLHTG